VAGNTAADGITNPPIDDLLDVVDSKYRLVIMAAKRARQINAYYAQLGEGLLEYVGRWSKPACRRSPCRSRSARSGGGCCPPWRRPRADP